MLLGPITHRDWRGQPNLPQTGGVMIVANHISNVDPLVLAQYLAYSGRWPHYLAKASLSPSRWSAGCSGRWDRFPCTGLRRRTGG